MDGKYRAGDINVFSHDCAVGLRGYENLFVKKGVKLTGKQQPAPFPEQ